MKFEILTAVTLKITVMWDVMNATFLMSLLPSSLGQKSKINVGKSGIDIWEREDWDLGPE